MATRTKADAAHPRVRGRPYVQDAKAALLEEMRGKASELGLSLNDVFPTRRQRKNKAAVQVKYRSPDGETWSGRGHAPHVQGVTLNHTIFAREECQLV